MQWQLPDSDSRIPKRIPFIGRLPNYSEVALLCLCKESVNCPCCPHARIYLLKAPFELSRTSILHSLFCPRAKRDFYTFLLRQRTPGFSWTDTNRSGGTPGHPGTTPIDRWECREKIFVEPSTAASATTSLDLCAIVIASSATKRSNS